MSNTQIIVLAAGHGKRMGANNCPKVLLPFRGKPIVKHLMESIKKTGFCDHPVVVVGQMANQVINALGKENTYVYQKKQLGTADAVKSCKNSISPQIENIMTLYGDHPLLTSVSIRNIINKHLQSKRVLTMATVTVTDFSSWRGVFYHWGRIIRNGHNEIDRIVEFKDATDKEKEIKEVNPSFFCFKAKWLWENIEKINNNNAAGEYYLTDFAHLAKKQRHKIATVPINPEEACGVNTPEELEKALSVKK